MKVNVLVKYLIFKSIYETENAGKISYFQVSMKLKVLVYYITLKSIYENEKLSLSFIEP